MFTVISIPPASMPKRRRRVRSVLLVFCLVWLTTAVYHSLKPMPPGTHVDAGPYRLADTDVQFLADVTVGDDLGKRAFDQRIFDQVFRLIDSARDFVVLDFFLINDDRGALAKAAPPHRALSRELIDHLLARKRALPSLRVLLITDPVNDVYGAAPNEGLAALRAAGIDVVSTRLDALRDPNPLYSGAYRLLIGWWIGDGSGGVSFLPNPMEDGPGRVSLRSWLTLLNLKANHRKLVAADDGNGGMVAIVTSANPHDASSAHSNVALQVRGGIVADIIDSEISIATFSGWKGNWQAPPRAAAAGDGTLAVRYLTEGAIAEASIEQIDRSGDGDAIDIAMFYLSERRYIAALAKAAQRGVTVRIVLDPSKDAFGRTKDGLPNRSVAAELRRLSDERIQLRWYRTHGEQFHTKLLAIRGRDRFWICLGSANLTRRNVDDFNLEANLAVSGPLESSVEKDVRRWFEAIWGNDAAAAGAYSADYSAFEDGSTVQYWKYRLMEATGMSTW